MAAREREIAQLREQLQLEIKAEAQHAAGQAAELAGERMALQKQAAVLEQEKEEFKRWRQESKEELHKQLKVCPWQLINRAAVDGKSCSLMSHARAWKRC